MLKSNLTDTGKVACYVLGFEGLLQNAVMIELNPRCGAVIGMNCTERYVIISTLVTSIVVFVSICTVCNTNSTVVDIDSNLVYELGVSCLF